MFLVNGESPLALFGSNNYIFLLFKRDQLRNMHKDVFMYKSAIDIDQGFETGSEKQLFCTIVKHELAISANVHIEETKRNVLGFQVKNYFFHLHNFECTSTVDHTILLDLKRYI